MKELCIPQNALITKENLDSNQYTVALMKEGFRAGFIDRQDICKIQEQVMHILKDLIVRYTKGDSTSVRTETAESLLNSVYYTLDAYLGSFKDPEEGLAMLQEGRIGEAYESGIQIIDKRVKEAVVLSNWVIRHELNVPLKVYRSSVEEAIPDFFRNYNVIFGAHDTACSLDYPLVFDDMNVRGVNYMLNYLRTLKTETLFCELFRLEDIRKLLDIYGVTCRIEFEEVPLNIFEIVFNNSIFSVLAGNSPGTLTVSDIAFQLLDRRLKSMDAYVIREEMQKGIELVINGLKIEQPELKEYLYRCLNSLVPRLLTALENDNLSNIAMIYSEKELLRDKISLEQGNRMKNETFLELVSKISRSCDAKDKVELIRSEVNSVGDFVDILEAGCLYGDEYLELFAVLSDQEHAVMEKLVFGDRMSESVTELCGEHTWEQQYLRFLSRSHRLYELITPVL